MRVFGVAKTIAGAPGKAKQRLQGLHVRIREAPSVENRLPSQPKSLPALAHAQSGVAFGAYGQAQLFARICDPVFRHGDRLITPQGTVLANSR
jgi:hypothetical protein